MNMQSDKPFRIFQFAILLAALVLIVVGTISSITASREAVQHDLEVKLLVEQNQKILAGIEKIVSNREVCILNVENAELRREAEQDASDSSQIRK
jgi:hypothetical protein